MELTLGVDVGCGQSGGELRRKALKASRARARGTVAGLQAEPSCRGPGLPAEKLELSVGKAVSPTAYFGMRKNVPALRGASGSPAGSSSRWWGTDQEAIGMRQAPSSGHTAKSGYRNENEVR